MDRILDYIASGKEEGARLFAGGERDTEGDKAKGYFVKPTVFAEVRPEMQHRAGGDFRAGAERHPLPRARRRPWRSPTARSTAWPPRCGRATSGWRTAWPAEIKAGSVWINTYNAFDSGSPFGGYKQSGFGRDLGAHALEQYTNVKSVWVAM